MATKVLNDLFDYENRYIYQIQDYFKFSLDSILLAEFVDNLKDTNKILDMCTGNASIPLILSTKCHAQIEGVELHKEIYDLAIESVRYNKLDDKIILYNSDVKKMDGLVKYQYYDKIICNPPFFKNDSALVNEDLILAIARHELKVTLEELFEIASRHLNNGGSFYLVHRASRLDEIVEYGIKYNLRAKKLQLIKTKPSKNPQIVLIKCVKGSSNGIIINDVVDISMLKTYKNLFK